MSKSLLIANVVLLSAAALAAAHIVRVIAEPATRAESARPRPATPAALTARPGAVPIGPATASYAIVATRNLFSPTRAEAPATGTAAAGLVAVQLPKPNLYGVVLRDGASVAYLEDPATKRVAAYRVGDAIAGGTVQTISADQVTLRRGDGQVAVRLHDPTRPRPALPGQPGVPQPGQPGVPQPGQPFVPQPGQFMPQPALPALGQPSVVGQVTPSTPAFTGQPMPHPQGQDPAEQPLVPGRRPVPPNLLRRVPSTPATDATTR